MHVHVVAEQHYRSECSQLNIERDLDFTIIIILCIQESLMHIRVLPKPCGDGRACEYGERHADALVLVSWHDLLGT